MSEYHPYNFQILSVHEMHRIQKINFFQKNHGDDNGDNPKDKDWEPCYGVEPSDDYDDDDEQHLFQTPAVPDIPTVPQLNLHPQHDFKIDLQLLVSFYCQKLVR